MFKIYHLQQLVWFLFTFVLMSTTPPEIEAALMLVNYSPIIYANESTSIACVHLPPNEASLPDDHKLQILFNKTFPKKIVDITKKAISTPLMRNSGKQLTWTHSSAAKMSGDFRCTRGEDKVETFKLLSTASLRSDVSTKVVTIGADVEIIMMKRVAGNEGGSVRKNRIIWWKDGRKLEDVDRFVQSRTSVGFKLRISNVTKADAGIYFANLQNEKRQNAAGFLLVIKSDIIRCPTCNNGGICDENSASCQCSPGYAGTDCSQVCQTNHFGPACMFNCGELSDNRQADCRGLQVCYSTGCRCAAGWKGSNCDQPCGEGEYGSDCSLDCNCLPLEQCDHQQGCICREENLVNGRCVQTSSGNIAAATTEASLQESPNVPVLPIIDPIITVFNDSLMVNPGGKAIVKCTVETHPPVKPPNHANVYLSSLLNPEDIWPRRSIYHEHSTATEFEVQVESSYPGPYWCKAKIGDKIYSQKFSFTIKVLPIPISPPYLVPSYNRTNSLKINLNTNKYKGDGPIVKQVLIYRKHQSIHFVTFPGTIVNDTALIEGLEPYTLYGFIVILHRPGLNSKPVHGPEALLRTNCGRPKRGPTIVYSYATDFTTMFISWRVPDIKVVQGKVLGYEIFFKQLGLGEEGSWQDLKITIGSKTSTTLSHMKKQAIYSVRMNLYNCNGSSPYTDPVRITMGKLETPTGSQVTVGRVNSTSIPYSWETPSNAQPYTILSYEIFFCEIYNETHTNERRLNVTGREYMYAGLQPFTPYIFKVRAFNHEGPGNFSREIEVKTKEAAPTAPLEQKVSTFDESSLQLVWREPTKKNGVIRNYQVQIQSTEKIWTDYNCTLISDFEQITKSCYIDNLEEYTSYKLRVRARTIVSGPWSDVIKAKTKSTTPLAKPIDVQAKARSGSEIELKWKAPPEDPYWGPLVGYQVIYDDDSAQMHQNWNTKFVPVPNTSTIITGLRPETVYHFCIAAKSEKIGTFTNKKSTRTYPLGPPPPATMFKCTNTSSTTATFAWDYVENYKISIAFIKISGEKFTFNAWYKKGEVKLLDPSKKYIAEIVLKNTHGISTGNIHLSFTTKKSRSGPLSFDNPYYWTALALGLISMIFLFVFIVFVIKHCKNQTKDAQLATPNLNVHMDTISTNFRESTFGSSTQGPINSRSGTMNSTNSRQTSVQYIPEHLIVQWRDILFEDIPLGTGNFGQVVKAVVQKDNKIISAAVKMLKEGSTVEDRRDFASELETMIRIGKHKNVISLIGACEHDSSMYLCTEFAPHGNLLQYLRRSRRLDGSNANELGTYTTLTQAQILQFAYEVAQGMNYLSEKQLIHRDLAARNVLLGESCVCKVADFGLSRGEGIYVKQTASRLPIRWMAIESLNYNVYTTKSDVWSFGILLWEIVSLGGTPYCGMSCAELYEKLPTGYRMKKPVNCAEEIYTLMYKCWKDRPHDRPTFFQLSIALERMCESKADHNYVNLAIFDDFNFASIDVNEEQA